VAFPGPQHLARSCRGSSPRGLLPPRAAVGGGPRPPPPPPPPAPPPTSPPAAAQRGEWSQLWWQQPDLQPRRRQALWLGVAASPTRWGPSEGPHTELLQLVSCIASRCQHQHSWNFPLALALEKSGASSTEADMRCYYSVLREALQAVRLQHAALQAVRLQHAALLAALHGMPNSTLMESVCRPSG